MPRGGSVHSFPQPAAPTCASMGAAAWRRKDNAYATAQRATPDPSVTWVSAGLKGSRKSAPMWDGQGREGQRRMGKRMNGSHQSLPLASGSPLTP